MSDESSMSTSPAKMIQEYAESLRANGYALTTIDDYSRDVNALVTWLTKRSVSLTKVGTQDILDYVRTIRDKVSPTSVKRYIISMQGFFAFLVEHGVRTGNPVDSIPKPNVRRRPTPPPPTPHEVGALLAAPHPSGKQGRRNSIMVKLIATVGMRVSQVSKLKVRDIDFVTGRCSINQRGKGTIHFFLDAHLLEEIREYLRDQKSITAAGDDAYLFPSREGGYLTRQAIWHALVRTQGLAGIERRITCVDLRRYVRANKKEDSSS